MFDPTTLVGLHTWLSLVAIAAGLPAVAGLLGGRVRPGWTAAYLASATATSVSGFLLPFTGFLPSHAFGIVSLLLLAPAAYGFWIRGRGGRWRRFHDVALTISLYLLLFVGVVQAFLKVPALHALAPTQTEPSFAIPQAVLLVACAAVLWRCLRRPTSAGISAPA